MELIGLDTIMFKVLGLFLVLASWSQSIQSIDNGEEGLFKQIRQPKAEPAKPEPPDRKTFDLNYDDDVGYSWNVLNVVMKTNAKAEQSKLPRKIRDAESEDGCSDADYYPYDYDQFRREYFDLNWDRRNDSRFEPGKPKKSIVYVCMPDDWRDGFGLLALYCTLHSGFEQGFTQPVISRLAQIIKFWLIVYLVAGGSLWIICGWCCCCLKCKIFKPEEIRKEVRRYILQNPPGVLRGYVTNEEMIYKPTQEEIEVYNELEIKAYAYV